MYLEKIKQLGYNEKDLIGGGIHPLHPIQLPKLFEWFTPECIAKEKYIILWDVDVDGVFAGYIAYRMLTRTFPNIRVRNYINETKVHGITQAFIRYCKEHEITTVIIVDAGTNDVEEISLLNNMGIKVIVIDHHIKTEDYEHDNFILINSSEYEYGANVSGAFLTNEVMKRIYEEYRKNTVNAFNEMAVISLVADVCKRDEYNRKAIMDFIFGRCEETDIIRLFRTKYTKDSVQFILSMSSNLNAILRYYGTRKVMHLMLYDNAGLKELVKNCKQIKSWNEEILLDIIKQSKVYELDNLTMVVVEDPMKEQGIFVRNYLGILANRVSSASGKLCLVLGSRRVNYEVESTDYKYCFSARDTLNRDTLTEAQESDINANGHPSAWGGYLTENYVYKLQELDNRLNLTFSEKSKGLIVPTQNIAHALAEINPNLIYLSLWNSIKDDEDKIKFEFTLEGQMTKKQRIKEIKFKDFKFKSFEEHLTIGDKVHLLLEFNDGVDYIIKKA